MEKIIRGIIQIGSVPDSEECLKNWNRFQEYSLDFSNIEDKHIFDYLNKFYSQMSSPPDFSIVKEYFEKEDNVEVVSRLDEIKSVQPYIGTNYLAIVRAEEDRQQTKNLVALLRDSGIIAEHGKNIQKPINGKKVLKGVPDAVNYLYDKLHDFMRVEGGEKLEGVISEDVEEFLDEYEVTEKTDKLAGRNLFGLEPVDSVCRGHRMGELWIHTAFAGELKCVAGSSTIYDHKAKRRRTISEVFEYGDLPVVTALAHEGSEPKLVKAPVSHVTRNGVKPTYEIQLESGRRTVTTSNHGFWTTKGWRHLRSIKPGDWVAVPRHVTVDDPDTSYMDAEVKIIGYLLGDECVSGNSSPNFTALNSEIRYDFMECLRMLGMSDTKKDLPRFKETLPANRTTGVRISKSKGGGNAAYVSPVQELLECLRMIGKFAATKSIPEEFFGLPQHQISILLGALWSTNGSSHLSDYVRKDRKSLNKRNDIKYYSTSSSLCSDVQSILLRLGIRSTVTGYEIEYDGKPCPVWVTSVVGAMSKRKFVELVSVTGKQSMFDAIKSRLPQWDNDPYPSELVGRDLVADLPSAVLHRETISGDLAKNFAKCQGASKRLRDAVSGDISWERVIKIVPKGKQMTYDVSVPEHHSFVVDDIVTHNTSLALNYAYNNAYVYGKNIFYGILEMPYKQLRRQLYVIHSSHGKFVTEWWKEDEKLGLHPSQRYIGLDYRKVRDGELSPLEKERMKIIASDFRTTSKGCLFVWRPQDETTILDIRRKAEMFHNKYGCDGIVVDHLGLVKPRHRTSDFVTSQNSVVRECRLMALNFARGRGVPVLALFQMNRQGKLRADKNDGRYDISAISYANECEKSADVITWTYLNDQLRKDAKFYLGNLKNRDNPIFDRMVGKIIWMSKRMRAMESGMIDMNNDLIVSASQHISQLSVEDLMI